MPSKEVAEALEAVTKLLGEEMIRFGNKHSEFDSGYKNGLITAVVFINQIKETTDASM
jgi:hypothetical protein